jgi:hypothetical protein
VLAKVGMPFESIPFRYFDTQFVKINLAKCCVKFLKLQQLASAYDAAEIQANSLKL